MNSCLYFEVIIIYHFSKKGITKMLVQIIKNWDDPNLLRQTPKNLGIWRGIKFTLGSTKECDYIIVLNHVSQDTEVYCSKKNIWAVMQEPYIVGSHEWMIEGHKNFSKIFTHHIFNNNNKYIVSNPMLPWHIDKNYNELINIKIPKKTKNISWITSNKRIFPGHKPRMKFFDFIKSNKYLNIDLYGRGINELDDKWDGLAEYKYSLAIENSSSQDYWTEKIADCFLSYTMPIYYGCTNIDEYFPINSMIKIDINKPQEAIGIMQKALDEDIWSKNLESIQEARELVLNKYNFFAQIANKIDMNNKEPRNKEKIFLKKYKKSFKRKILTRLEQLYKKLNGFKLF